MSRGSYETLSAKNIEGFAELLKSGRFGPDCALSFGICKSGGSGRVAAADIIDKGQAKGAISRTRENFDYIAGQPAIFFIDCDMLPGRPMNPAEIDRILCDASSWLAPARRFYIPSASSELYDNDTFEKLSTKTSFHCYLLVDDGAQIPRIQDRLFADLFEAGYGKIIPSKCGSALLRTFVDRMVSQPERLDFAFGGQLSEEIVQHRWLHWAGHDDLLRAASVPPIDFKQWEAASEVMARLKSEAEPACAAQREIWAAERAEEQIDREDKAERQKGRQPAPEARQKRVEAAKQRFIRSAVTLILEESHVLETRHHGLVTVGEMIRNPQLYHLATMKEPLEPEYGGGSTTVAKAFLLNQTCFPVINSNAHGGTQDGIKYRLPKLAGQTSINNRSQPVIAETNRETIGFLASQKSNESAQDDDIQTPQHGETDASPEQELSASNEVGPEFSEDALATTFSERHGDDLRYVAPWGKWLRWDGCRWAFDETLAVFDLARAICRDAANESEKPGEAKAIASAKTVAAVERLAKADRRHACTVDAWDHDAWLLNTPAATIDLRTGDSRSHDRRDLLTKITPVGPHGECPVFCGFLKRVTGDDEDLQKFLKRMAGYMLTGSTREHALFFLYGTGRNGKSVFINTLAGLLGEYHCTAPMEAFTASNSERHPTELAMMRGARLVTAIETEEGRSWAESRIKALTGGDRISARFMRQDFFEFVPQFKLLIAGNHKPSLRNVDEAIRRRLHLIPFTVTIPPEEVDELLPEKLRAEWPGILSWAIEGTIEWLEQGLNPPKSVQDATAEYLSEEDGFAKWVEECCERDSNSWEKTSDLYRSWKTWADRSGELSVSEKSFSQMLSSRGFRFHRRMNGRGYYGLAINRADYTDNVRYGG